MFCPNCGTKALEGADFCQKCGTKLIADNAQQKQQNVVDRQTQTQSDSSPADTPKKKKSKKIPIIIGIVIAAVIFVAALSNGDKDDPPNLFQIAEAVAPMTEFGYDATYGDLFDWLITNGRISLEQDGDVAYLTFSGNVTGGDYPVSIVLKMTGLSVNADSQRLEPYAMTLNGIEVPDFNNPQGMLSKLFMAQKYKADNPTFMDFLNWSIENKTGIFYRYFDGIDGLDSDSNK